MCVCVAADQQAEGHREETKKLKAYVVKMKKELAEARDKMATSALSSEEKAELQRQLDEMRESVGAGQQRSGVTTCLWGEFSCVFPQCWRE